MKKLFIPLAFAIAGGNVTAGESSTSAKVNSNAEAKVQAGDIAKLEAIYTMAQIGIDKKDSVILVAAARALNSLSPKDQDRKKTSEGGIKSSKSEKPSLTADQMLTYASDYAGDNSGLKAIISETKTVSRGRTNGPGLTRTSVNAHSTDYFDLTFRGEETAEILVDGDGDTDLDLYVK